MYHWRELAGQARRRDLLQPLLTGLSALFGVPQNDTAPLMIDEAPFLDLLESTKAAEADQVIVQAAISHARGLDGAVDIAHEQRTPLRGLELNHSSDR